MAVKQALALLESLSKKMHWEQLKALLKKYDYKVHRGSINTVEKFKEFLSKDVEALKFIDTFKNYYLEVLTGGQKTVQIFTLPDDFVLTHTLVDDPFNVEGDSYKLAREHFPYLIPEDLISDVSDVELIHFEIKGEKTYFYFSTIRSITEKKEIVPKEYLDNEQNEVAEFLKQYKKVTVFEEKLKQYIDIVCINYMDNTVDIRLDSDLISGQKELDHAFSAVKNSFVKIHGLSRSNAFRKPLNFYPLIERLYTSDNYRVCELTFCTDEGYVHNERNRNKQKGSDVRTGSFHIGGRDNCEDLQPYKISIRWDSSLKKDDKKDNSEHTEVELSLNATLAELSRKGGGELFYAIMSSSVLKYDQDIFFQILKKLNNEYI
ncbi:hypothetical protein H5158_13155 [Pseudoalteromonas sp. SR45-6]|uniref:hypothetical protein n=1 Tax=Pseudoalteromonas sp. SR45-6 TaxID=2760927 RepID=UPI0015FEFC32|nr:hypothetical protein [Pseudoalteromonas sp. SR45-6]MBB1342580.1 hypothetical protein [Pseudoalteromonas sp. SR45-6]